MGESFTNSRILSIIVLIVIINTVSAQEEFRLVAGNGRGNGISSGRVEVRRNSTLPWGTVAVYSGDFRNKEAQLVCKILGYKYGEAKPNAYYGRGTPNVLIRGLNCRTATTFYDCRIYWSSGTQYNYRHNYDVGVNCFNSTAQIINDRHFESYGNHDAGVVVLWNDGWKLICDNRWNDESAAVVCRGAGFLDGKALCCSQLSSIYSNPSVTGRYKYYLNVDCSENDTDLFDCSNPYYNSCRSGHLASVICYNTTLSNVNNTFDVRLVNTTGSSGTLEVRRNGYWALVTGDSGTGWNEAAANVSCRQMGYTGGIAYYRDRKSLRQMFWIQNLNCNGSENSLEQCVTQWGRSTDMYEAYVICYRDNIELSLVNGSRTYGRVQLSIDGVPGTICNRGYYGPSMASVVCRQLGFGQGTELVAGYFGIGDGPVYLGSVLCNTNNSIWDCRYNHDWKSPNSICETHSYDLTVKCHGKVKIDGGDHSNGIVYEQNTSNNWKIVCSNGFTVHAAKVLCRELGFTNGTVLPSGTFGAASSQYSSLVFNCKGNETTLSQCTTRSTPCEGFSKKYAAVQCFDGAPNTERKLKLKGSPSHPNTGLVTVSLNGFTGGICSDFFTEEAVKIVCRELGHTNGMVYRYPTTVNMYAIQELQCVGNESSIFDCPVGSSSCLARAYEAGVFCYNNTAPVLRFITGASGKLEVVDGLDVGGVCLTSDKFGSQSTSQASVICRQMNFRSGEFFSSFQEETEPIFMNTVRCTGDESSIYDCLNDGWRVNEDSQCPSDNKALSCYNNVRLRRRMWVGGSYSSGYVEMLYADRYWNPVCPGLDDNAARVICRELGAPYFKVLADNLFQLNERNNHGMRNIACVGNETSIINCSYTKKPCWGTSSLFCGRTSKLDDFDIHPSPTGENGPFYSEIRIEMYGLLGTICSEGWTDTAAKVFCKSQGYLYGVSIGSVSSMYTIQSLAKDFRCTGEEIRLQDCNYSTANLTACQSPRMYANALCSNETEGLSIRLASSNQSRNIGQVQVGYHGQWGPVCKQRYYVNRYLAATACRQLGYVNGEDISEDISESSYSSQPSMLSIYGHDGCGNETEIWKCKLEDFNATYMCGSYRRVLVVKCLTSVDLRPGHNVGVAKFTVNGRTGLICKDGFDTKAAKVACEQLGYIYYYLLDYHPFIKPPNIAIAYNNFRCSGLESSLEMCRYDTQYCRSNRAVQLMCSNYPPHSGYTLKIKSSTYGAVIVNHFDINGGICSDSWTNNDAKVVCRELYGSEYTGGFAYKRLKSEDEMSPLGIKWLTNLNCTGNESAIGQCNHSQWGDISNCSTNTEAAVYCLRNSAAAIGIKLEGGDNKSGRIRVSAIGVWGSVCGRDFTDREASVVCRMLNFKGGHVTVNNYGRNSGPIHISQMDCTGDEQSVFDCGLKITETRSSCKYDVGAAVRCYNYVRMTGSTISYVNYGKLELLINEWKPVCDAGFTELMAEKACKDMGYESGSYVCCSSLGEGDSRSMVSLSRCRETPGSLSETCYVNTGCSSGKYVTVYCSKTTFSNSNIVTLILRDKRVIVTVAGIQSAICAQNWTDNEANVSCKHAGYNGGIATFTSNENISPVLLGNIKCRGIEANLTECSRTRHSTGCSETLTNKQVISGAICYYNEVPHVLIKNDYPQLHVNGNQYSICLNDPGTKAICRQLGYLDSYLSTNYNYIRSHYQFICKGDEESIFQCITMTESNYCRQPKITCFNHVRIINAGNDAPGYLSVTIDGNFGHICSEGWTNTNTLVVCRELGYSNGYAMIGSALRDSLAIMDRVNCSGEESSIVDCPYSKPYIPICHNQIRVKCLNGNRTTDFTWSSGYSGSNPMGSLTVYYDNLRGYICLDNWDDVDATVACKQIGFTIGTALRIQSTTRRPYLLSNVNCNGSESRLDDCEFDIGDITHCSSHYVAGIVCSSQTGIFSGLLGDNGIGLAQISIDGTWGVFCENIGNDGAYNVLCKSMGYTSGHYGSRVGRQGYNFTGPVYNTFFSCSGHEADITDCPHSSLRRNDQCPYFASVHCLNDVRLHEDDQHTTLPRLGPVEIYYQDQWYLVCDDGFDDAAAERVCSDLGFADGKAIHGSTFGWDYVSRLEVSNMSLNCNGSERSARGCLSISSCSSGQYASVVCFNETDIDEEYLESDYVFSIERQSTVVNSSGMVGVSIFGVQGKICADDWDDDDAVVYCRSRGYSVGIAYKNHPKLDKHLPFWIGKFECAGTESNLNLCIHKNRFTMEKCESHSGASVVCHDGNFDASFRFANLTVDKRTSGQIYLTIDGVEGGLCKDLIDNNAANVFCRQSGFDGGWKKNNPNVSETFEWMIDFKCSGNEKNLLDCSHSGFHQTDIGHRCAPSYIECVNSVYLWRDGEVAQKYGGVRIYDGSKGQWSAVCDDIFGDIEASVVCKSVSSRYIGGIPIPGSVYGNLDDIVNTTRRCNGTEALYTDCPIVSSDCESGRYASVQCFDTRPNTTTLTLSLHSEYRSNFVGYLNVILPSGAAGMVCSEGFGKNEAIVACKQLGYIGGVPYLPNRYLRNPIILADVSCSGEENTLADCQYNTTSTKYHCDYYSKRAGVLCYNTSGVNYRLTGGDRPGEGYVQMQYDGEWGNICATRYSHPYNAVSKVLCREVGYKDGIAMYDPRSVVSATSKAWFYSLTCDGDETTPTNCFSYGFNYSRTCELTLFLKCYNQSLEISDLRLIGGDNYGRVEVYMQGPNEWGTVCGYYFSDVEAGVICGQLGYSTGKAVLLGGLGIGQGPIWISNLDCNGTESKLTDCEHSYYTLPLCAHTNDAGVICSGQILETVQTTPAFETTAIGETITNTTAPTPTTNTTTKPRANATTPTATWIATTTEPTSNATMPKTTELTANATMPKTTVPTTNATAPTTTSTVKATATTIEPTSNELTITASITSSRPPISTTETVDTTIVKQVTTSSTIDPNKNTGKPSITPGEPEKTTVGEKGNNDSQSLLSDKEVTITIGSVLGSAIVILIVIVILIYRKKRLGGYMLSDGLSELSSTKLSEF